MATVDCRAPLQAPAVSHFPFFTLNIIAGSAAKVTAAAFHQLYPAVLSAACLCTGIILLLHLHTSLGKK